MEVETATLDEAVGDLGLPPPDYLKLDIEGAELGVLQAGRAALAGCAAIEVECAFLEQRLGQPLAHDVIAFLRGQGFELDEIRDMHAGGAEDPGASPPCAPSRTLFAWAPRPGRSIFLRAPESLAEDDAALRAVVTAAVLGFIDYGIGILRQRPSIGASSEGGPSAWSTRSCRHRTR